MVLGYRIPKPLQLGCPQEGIKGWQEMNTRLLGAIEVGVALFRMAYQGPGVGGGDSLRICIFTSTPLLLFLRMIDCYGTVRWEMY